MVPSALYPPMVLNAHHISSSEAVAEMAQTRIKVR